MSKGVCETCGHAPPQKVLRNLSTPEARAFWADIEKVTEKAKEGPVYLRAFYKADEVCPDCGHFLGWSSPILSSSI